MNMKRIFLSLLAMIPISATLCAQEIKEHTVANGETLQSIASKYNVTIGQLKSSNSGLDDYVFAGMVLKIPTIKESVSSKEVIPVDDLKDIIYLKDGSELVAKILTIETDVVKFEQYDTDEPFSISKEKILSITFEDGRVTDFTTPKKKVTTSKKRKK